MNRRLAKTCVSTIYLHGWFVPLFLLLLGIKICLLSFIADAIKNRQYHSSTKLDGYIRLKQIEKHSIRKTIVRKRNSSPSEVSSIPKNLMEMDINPTDKNRTSSTSIWLIYNAVPKCGDEQAVQLIEKLSNRNRFSHQQHEYQTPWPRFLLENEQDNLVQWFQYQHLPKSYNRHFFYVNFGKFQKYAKERPIYINFVRDPIDRLVLDYYSRRNISSASTKEEIRRRNAERTGSGTEWYRRTYEECVLQADPECRYTAGEKSFTLMIPFFCGQHNSCVVINDRWALQMAKFNIESEYSVVGALEKMDQTLRALEKFVPRFFSGATQLYNELSTASDPQSRKHFVSSFIRQIMENELYNEVELYQFICRRLALQSNDFGKYKMDRNMRFFNGELL